MKSKLLALLLLLALPTVSLCMEPEDDVFEGQDFANDFMIGDMDKEYPEDEEWVEGPEFLEEEEMMPMEEEMPEEEDMYEEEEPSAEMNVEGDEEINE